MLVVAALLVLSIGLVQGLTFSLPNSIAQCSRFTVGWSNAPEALSFQAFNVSVLPFDAVPFILNVPPTAWTSNTSGSFDATVPIIAGVSFVLSTGGSGDTGGTSNMVAVSPSAETECLRQSPPPSAFSFATSPINCNPSFLNISFFSSDGSVPIVRGYVPRGLGPFDVAPLQTGGKTFFAVSVDQETQMLLSFTGPNDLAGVSRLITVGGSQAISRCLQNLVFTAPTNLSVSNSAAQTDSPVLRNQSGKIIGIVVGAVLGTFAIAWGMFLCRERYRTRDKAGRGRRIRDSEFGMVTGISPPPEKALEEKQRERESKLFPYSSSAYTNTAIPPVPTLSLFGGVKRPPLGRFGSTVRKSMIGRPTNPPDPFDPQSAVNTTNLQTDATSTINDLGPERSKTGGDTGRTV